MLDPDCDTAFFGGYFAFLPGKTVLGLSVLRPRVRNILAMRLVHVFMRAAHALGVASSSPSIHKCLSSLSPSLFRPLVADFSFQSVFILCSEVILDLCCG